jgi:hypothetical protein
MSDLRKRETRCQPPTVRIEDLGDVSDDVEAARIANEWAIYARGRVRVAIEARDARIRAARTRGASQPAIAAGTGLSLASVRVITR